MTTSQSSLITLTVDTNVFGMLLLKLLECLEDALVTLSVVLVERFEAEVGVASSSIPVTSNGFGIEVNKDSEFLANTLHDVSRHPQLITSSNSNNWSYLVFPLSSHDLCVDSRDIDSGVKASTVVAVSDFSSDGVLMSNRAVIGSLGGRESVAGPAQMVSLAIKERVFLLKSEHGASIVANLVENLDGRGSGVGGQRSSIRSGSVAHDEDVVSTAERITEDGTRSDEDLRIVAWCLTGAATVIIPDREIFWFGWNLAASSGFASQIKPTSSNPNVLGKDSVVRDFEFLKVVVNALVTNKAHTADQMLLNTGHTKIINYDTKSDKKSKK